jgi:hypothetical protein
MIGHSVWQAARVAFALRILLLAVADRLEGIAARLEAWADPEGLLN